MNCPSVVLIQTRSRLKATRWEFSSQIGVLSKRFQVCHVWTELSPARRRKILQRCLLALLAPPPSLLSAVNSDKMKKLFHALFIFTLLASSTVLTAQQHHHHGAKAAMQVLSWRNSVRCICRSPALLQCRLPLSVVSRYCIPPGTRSPQAVSIRSRCRSAMRHGALGHRYDRSRS
jgi:hypothetical protein